MHGYGSGGDDNDDDDDDIWGASNKNFDAWICILTAIQWS
jgi:hypothetical protein